MMKKPVVFHSRDAGMEVLSLSRPLLPMDHPIHLHCCIQEWSEVMVWKWTFSNIVFSVTAGCTYPQQDLARHCATLILLCSMVLETDAPYFRPYDAPTTLEFSDPQMGLARGAGGCEIAACPSV